MRSVRLWLVTACVLVGCSPAMPSATQYPAPVASAAQPGVTAKGEGAYARRSLEAMRGALREMDEDAVAAIPARGLNLPDAGVAARCAAAGGDMPTLVCHFGPSASQPVAQAIFWYRREVWEAQLYPQAPPKLAAERAAQLADQGCRLGCSSGVVRARQMPGPDGREMLVVVDLGYTAGQTAEEAQVLRFDNNRWEVLWAPAAGDWNYGHARVELPARGMAGFKVHSSSWLRQDSLSGYLSEAPAGDHRLFTERWVRKGTDYVMADHAEEPTPYGSLVRLIHYLSAGGDEKAAALLSPDVDLEEARKALAQKPRRQGWNVTRWGEHGFLLETRGTGKPDLGIRFQRRGDTWVAAEIWHTVH